MKNMMLLAVAAMTLATAAKAGSQNDAGCGLGTLVFKNNTAVEQVLAATTNGTSGNQTFGITTGTLGCSASGNLGLSSRQTDFVTVNLRNVTRDMSVGRGEYLGALAGLLGCENSVDTLGRLTQSKYQTIVPTPTSTPEQILGALKTEIRADAALSGSCTLL